MLFGEIDQRWQRLRQRQEEQVLIAGLHHAFEQRKAVLFGSQIRIIKEGKTDIISGRPDNGVNLLTRAICENDGIRLKPVNRPSGGNVAATDAGQKFARDRRVGIQWLMVRLWQAIVFGIANFFLDLGPRQRASDFGWHPAGQHSFIRGLSA